MSSDSSIKYSSVKDEEDLSDYGVSQLRIPNASLWERLVPRVSVNFTAFLSLILAWMISFFAAMSFVQQRAPRTAPGHLTQTSTYSPFIEQIDIPLVNQKVKITLFPNASNPEHIYRLRPSPEVDAAWDRISMVHYFPITKDEVAKIGNNPEQMIVVPDSWGLGRDEHDNGKGFTNMDVFHQLHCLNAIRKGLVHNYDYYTGKKDGFEPTWLYEFHLDHCLDIVRQALMCHADVNAIAHVWAETQGVPWPDLGIHRTCKDFDTLLQWQEEHMIPNMAEKWDNLKKPGDANLFPGPYGIPQPEEYGAREKANGKYVKELPGLEGVDYCLGDKRKPGTS